MVFRTEKKGVFICNMLLHCALKIKKYLQDFIAKFNIKGTVSLKSNIMQIHVMINDK